MGEIFQEVEYNKALVLASRVHKGQVRAGTSEPYIVHPMAVAQILMHYGCDHSEVIAGLLHDTIEDTKDPKKKADLIQEILTNFGFLVLQLVKGVTKISTHEDGNRIARTKIDIFYYVSRPEGCHNIKIADVMHNLSRIDSLDRGFAKTYLFEKHLLISEFEKNGKADPEMLKDVRALIDKLRIEFNK